MTACGLTVAVPALTSVWFCRVYVCATVSNTHPGGTVLSDYLDAFPRTSTHSPSSEPRQTSEASGALPAVSYLARLQIADLETGPPAGAACPSLHTHLKS